MCSYRKGYITDIAYVELLMALHIFSNCTTVFASNVIVVHFL